MRHFVCSNCGVTRVADDTLAATIAGEYHAMCPDGHGTWIRMPNPSDTPEQDTERFVKSVATLLRVLRPDLAKREGYRVKGDLPTAEEAWRSVVWDLACVSTWIDAGHREPWE